ncbi:unnamed protein product, partial [Protopolystoma xenopodis]
MFNSAPPSDDTQDALQGALEPHLQDNKASISSEVEPFSETGTSKSSTPLDKMNIIVSHDPERNNIAEQCKTIVPEGSDRNGGDNVSNNGSSDETGKQPTKLSDLDSLASGSIQPASTSMSLEETSVSLMVDAADLDYGDGDGDGDLEAQHENVTTPAASGKSSTCQGPVLEVPTPQLLHTPLANTSTTPEDAGLPS